MSGDAARLAAEIAKWCICIPAYKQRGLLDPECRHDEIEELIEQRESARDIAVSLENELAEQAYQRVTDLWITAADYEEGWHD